MDDLLQQGIAASQNGKRDEARRLLISFVKQNPDNESGWGWLFNVCDTDKERVDCLKQVVRINPHNEKANQLLRKYSLPKQPINQPVVGKVVNQDLKNDVLARKVTRFLVIFQVSALLLGIFFTLIRFSSIALFIAFVSLVLLIGALIWFNIRYRTYPIVQEKRKLAQQTKSLQAQILVHSTNINLTQQNREKIKQAEQAELLASLQSIQKKHIDSGLTNTQISNADIPGIGPGLKQRLFANGFSTAASITPNVTNIEGFGPAKTQAILDWRAKVHSYLNATKPMDLPPEMYNHIKNKFQIHHADNDAEEHKIQETKTKLENTSKEIQPRINTLAPFTFGFFLRNALGSKGVVAAITGGSLILSQIFLGSSATFGAIVASIPTKTLTPTVTLTSTVTFTPTITFTPTFTQTPTITDTPTITETPTQTLTPTSTFTSTSTYTPTRTPTLTPLPTSINILPIGGSTLIPIEPPPQGSCCRVCGSDSQPCGDSCISLKYTCHKAPGCACK